MKKNWRNTRKKNQEEICIRNQAQVKKKKERIIKKKSKDNLCWNTLIKTGELKLLQFLSPDVHTCT